MQRLLAVVLVCVISACANEATLMRPSTQPPPQARAGEANITFMRSSSTLAGGNVAAAIYDVTDGTPQFIGLLPNDRKLAIATKIGKRRFMVYSAEASDFMEADLMDGKAYYTMVTPRSGAMSFRFSFRPIRNTSVGEFSFAHPKFMRWINDTVRVENTDGAITWATQKNGDVISQMKTYWPQWQNKPASERAEQTINASDFAPNFQ